MEQGFPDEYMPSAPHSCQSRGGRQEVKILGTQTQTQESRITQNGQKIKLFIFLNYAKHNANRFSNVNRKSADSRHKHQSFSERKKTKTEIVPSNNSCKNFPQRCRHEMFTLSVDALKFVGASNQSSNHLSILSLPCAQRGIIGVLYAVLQSAPAAALKSASACFCQHATHVRIHARV